jgi:hypothetical protein
MQRHLVLPRRQWAQRPEIQARTRDGHLHTSGVLRGLIGEFDSFGSLTSQVKGSHGAQRRVGSRESIARYGSRFARGRRAIAALYHRDRSWEREQNRIRC